MDITALTRGELLLYGGIAGMCLTLCITVTVIAVLSHKSKRIQKDLTSAYGSIMKK